MGGWNLESDLTWNLAHREADTLRSALSLGKHSASLHLLAQIYNHPMETL